MKTPRFFLLIILSWLAVSLAACAGGGTITTSWPGVTVDTQAETVYVAYTQHIYSVNLTNGTEKWRFPAKADNKITFYSPTALTEDNQLVAGAYNSLLYSLKPENGQQNWVFDGAQSRYIAGPLVTTDSIFAPSSDNNLYTLNMLGALRWQFNTVDSQWATPSTDGKVIYLPSMDHKVYALDAGTGTSLWTTEDLGGSIAGSPTLQDGVLYVGTLGSEMLALDAQNGKILWRTPTTGWVWSGPALTDGTLYFGDLNGTLYAVNATDGKVRWQVQPDSSQTRAITGTPVIVKDTVYFGSESGNFYAVDAANGSPRWSKTLGGKLYASPVATGEIILVAPLGIDTVLFALDTNGNQKWAFIPAK